MVHIHPSSPGLQVIDLGVMVSCADIIAAAKREKVDVVGLSGLITPSLDEMVFVAKEMKKAGLKVSAVEGGAAPLGHMGTRADIPRAPLL